MKPSDCNNRHRKLIKSKKEYAGKLNDIDKVITKWYESRYDTDWDSLQGSLMKIKKILDRKDVPKT